jgi:two-component system phosphate regulon sensor histidine kinase PhoR
MANNCYVLGVYFPNETTFIYKQMLFWLVLSAIFIIIIILSFGFTTYSYIKQKKFSTIKNDFINNMTHELKTPISTISLSSEMLLQKEVLINPDKIIKYAKVIYDENNRLKSQVEHVLQAAITDKGTLELKKHEVNIHKIIEENIDKISTIIKNIEGKILFKPDALKYIVIADSVLISTVVSNLLDNACKYSKNKPEITIITYNIGEKIGISIKDKGIGISKEHLKDIFKEFYRITTGNIHDVKGFGLGLYFVKTIIEAHGGTIKVNSEINKGSKFEIILPLPRNSVQPK